LVGAVAIDEIDVGVAVPFSLVVVAGEVGDLDGNRGMGSSDEPHDLHCDA